MMGHKTDVYFGGDIFFNVSLRPESVLERCLFLCLCAFCRIKMVYNPNDRPNFNKIWNVISFGSCRRICFV